MTGNASTRPTGGTYGGGGAGKVSTSADPSAGLGGGGALRIIWPGSSRTFPSTCVAVTATEYGSAVYTSSGNYTWVAPTGVTKVSIVAIGGGASAGRGGSLGYKNNLTVTPGSSYTVVVGNANATSRFECTVKGSGGAVSCAPFYVGDGGGLGGTSAGLGGGGAGGYSWQWRISHRWIRR